MMEDEALLPPTKAGDPPAFRTAATYRGGTSAAAKLSSLSSAAQKSPAASSSRPVRHASKMSSLRHTDEHKGEEEEAENVPFTELELKQSRLEILQRARERSGNAHLGERDGSDAGGGPSGVRAMLAHAMMTYMENEDKKTQWMRLPEPRFRGAFLTFLERGVKVKKHGRKGSPRWRTLRVDDCSRLVWGSSKWATLSIGSITHILVGKKTINFLRSMPRQRTSTLSKLNLRLPTCVSLLTPTRSLDLEFEDHVSAELMAYAFRRLLAIS